MDIREELKKRILILDGGMGTCIQQTGLEYDGNNDALPLTRPDIISGIHKAYIDAGADIISTCTFGANAISQEGYGMQEQVRFHLITETGYRRSINTYAGFKSFF